MRLTGAQIVVETLIEQGCDTVFGYPGGFVLNIYDELYKNSDALTHVLSAHEQGAAHAADGYARASGKVGVVISTSGPGATNLVTGIATAYLDSSPIVAITGNVPLAMLGRDSFQEVDTMGITMPVTKHNYIIRSVCDLADTLREAFYIAKSGRPGPVLVDIPKDVQLDFCEFTPAAVREKAPLPVPGNEAFVKAAEMISSSKKPYIYCGGGVVISDAGREAAALAEKIDAVMGFSMMGLTAVPSNNPRNLGMAGMHGRYASTKAKSEADLIIAVGVRFSDRATGNKQRYTKNARIIHIDIDPAEIDKNIPVFGMVGDVKKTLAKLLESVSPQAHTGWRGEVEAMRREEEAVAPEPGEFHPESIFEKLMEFTDAQTVFATDVGQHQMWAAQYLKTQCPRTLLTSGGLGTMGFGMGASIGGCIASGRRRTVLITGDGSFGMNLNELATAVSNDLPIIIMIMNNGVLGMVRQWQTMFYDKRYSNTTLNRKTDFVKLAEAFGATGLRVCNMSGLEAALEKAFSLDSPVVIDCVVDSDERVLPMIPPGGSIDDIIVK